MFDIPELNKIVLQNQNLLDEHAQELDLHTEELENIEDKIGSLGLNSTYSQGASFKIENIPGKGWYRVAKFMRASSGIITLGLTINKSKSKSFQNLSLNFTGYTNYPNVENYGDNPTIIKNTHPTLYQLSNNLYGEDDHRVEITKVRIGYLTGNPGDDPTNPLACYFDVYIDTDVNISTSDNLDLNFNYSGRTDNNCIFFYKELAYPENLIEYIPLYSEPDNWETNYTNYYKRTYNGLDYTYEDLKTIEVFDPQKHYLKLDKNDTNTLWTKHEELRTYGKSSAVYRHYEYGQLTYYNVDLNSSSDIANVNINIREAKVLKSNFNENLINSNNIILSPYKKHNILYNNNGILKLKDEVEVTPELDGTILIEKFKNLSSDAVYRFFLDMYETKDVSIYANPRGCRIILTPGKYLVNGGLQLLCTTIYANVYRRDSAPMNNTIKKSDVNNGEVVSFSSDDYKNKLVIINQKNKKNCYFLDIPNGVNLYVLRAGLLLNNNDLIISGITGNTTKITVYPMIIPVGEYDLSNFNSFNIQKTIDNNFIFNIKLTDDDIYLSCKANKDDFYSYESLNLNLKKRQISSTTRDEFIVDDMTTNNFNFKYNYLKQYLVNNKIQTLENNISENQQLIEEYLNNPNIYGYLGDNTVIPNLSKLNDKYEIYDELHPIGDVISKSFDGDFSNYLGFKWSNIGSQTIGSTPLYFWKRIK